MRVTKATRLCAILPLELLLGRWGLFDTLKVVLTQLRWSDGRRKSQMRIFIVLLSLVACLMPWRMALAGDVAAYPAVFMTEDKIPVR